MGTPRLVGDMFGDDRGEISPLSLSMLYACNDGVDPRPLMDQWAQLGGEAGRWFASKLTPSATRTGNSLEASEARSEQIAVWLAERFLLGHAVGFCDTRSWQDWAQYESHARWFGRLLASHRHLIGEAVNEHGHESQVDFSEGDFNRIVGWIRGTYAGPLTAGAWVKADELVAGRYPPALISGCNVLDTHFERTDDPAWDMANHGFAELRAIQGEYAGQGRLSGEPKRTDDGVWPPQVFAYLLGVEAQGFNTWTTLHCSAGRDCQRLTGEQLKDAEHFIRGGRILPRGRYHYENANNTGRWGNSPVKNAAFCEGPSSSSEENVWRAHSFRHEATGQWFLTLYGPNIDRPFLEFQHGFHLDQRIDKVGPYVEVWTLKQ